MFKKEIKFEHIETKDDFIRFLSELIEEYKENGQNWENNSLELFLASMHSYCEDTADDYKRFTPEKLSWGNLANIIVAGAEYE